ncbi:MAG: hypothetical protein ABSC18_15340, partial [Verrucomicrobiota bacterium]
ALKAALCRFRFAFISLLFLIYSKPAKIETYPWSNFRGPPLVEQLPYHAEPPFPDPFGHFNARTTCCILIVRPLHAMSIQASKTVVRFSAAVSVLACSCCLTCLAAGIYDEMFRQPRIHINVLLLFLLESVLPVWFIWESVRAWRLLPKSIESLSIIYVLAGMNGVFGGMLFGFAFGWRIWNVGVLVVGLFLFLFGLWMNQQQKRLYGVA